MSDKCKKVTSHPNYDNYERHFFFNFYSFYIWAYLNIYKCTLKGKQGLKMYLTNGAKVVKKIIIKNGIGI